MLPNILASNPRGLENLSEYLDRLREDIKLITPLEVIHRENGAIQVINLDTDVSQLLQACRENQLSKIEDIYEGKFLPGVGNLKPKIDCWRKKSKKR